MIIEYVIMELLQQFQMTNNPIIESVTAHLVHLDYSIDD